jgi:hypothetical protein
MHRHKEKQQQLGFIGVQLSHQPSSSHPPAVFRLCKRGQSDDGLTSLLTTVKEQHNNNDEMGDLQLFLCHSSSRQLAHDEGIATTYAAGMTSF